ncbi:amidase [Inquilinus limosus]|uniref:Amidase n=1 Tax=Inquilinus limosus TaxID=171674 RepID=A0A211ZUT3_9PROT|nr:amidase [Inquilinus limosus]OWJ69062.1 amidase [Inquilinus limosus]
MRRAGWTGFWKSYGDAVTDGSRLILAPPDHALPVRAALSALAGGQVTAVELTRRALAAAESCRSAVNAFSVIAVEPALAAAAESGRRYRNGHQRPLEGLPVAVKDMIDTRGIETRYGSSAYLGHVPETDAGIVTALVEAGAVIIGKTTTHEFAWGVTTASPDFGDTLNPRHVGHIPGGSSGGSAAAIAYGVVTASLGTDTGGSVRIPAALCGVVGYKPSRGMLPATGIFPLARTLDHPGLIGGCIDDVVLLAGALGIKAADLDASVAPRLGIIREIPPVPLAPDVAAAFDRAVERMASAFPIDSSPAADLFDGVFAAFAGIVLAEGGMLHFGLSDDETLRTRYTPETRERLERARTVTIGDYALSRQVQRRFVERLTHAMTSVDYLVLPACPCVAPRRGEATVTISAWSGSVREALMTYTAPFNLAGFPAITIPLHGPTDDLPCALQVVARPGADGGMLSFARAVEALVGGDGALRP